MEDKLAKYIVNVAGSSYLLMAMIFLSVLLVSNDNPFEDSLFVKSLILLIVYIFSLVLVHFSKDKPIETKAFMWIASFCLHLIIIGFIIWQFGDIAALAIMFAECIILVLLLIAISSMGYKIYKGAQQNA